MSFVRVNVPLLPAESDALRELAGKERRRPEAQAAWLIRQELQRLGLLQEGRHTQPAGEGNHGSAG
jgi:hypothetical protein